jgi:hypothetical protein
MVHKSFEIFFILFYHYRAQEMPMDEKKDEKKPDIPEKKDKVGPSPHRGVPGRRDDRYKTQELTLDQIKKKMEIEKTRNNGSKPVPTSLPEIEEEEVKKEPLPGIEDARTQEVPKTLLDERRRQVKTEGELSKDDTGPIRVNQFPDLTGKTMVPKRRASNVARNFFLIFIPLLIIAVLFYIYKPWEKVMGPSAESSQSPAVSADTEVRPDSATQTQVAANQVEKPAAFELPEDVFYGVAPMQVKASGAVISDELDPEVSAIGDALKVRVEAIAGRIRKKLKGVNTESVSGRFRGFTVKHSLQKNEEEIINNEIVINTPSKGSMVIDQGVLSSIKRVDYNKLKQDLNRSGLEIIKDGSTEEGKMKVQLRVFTGDKKQMDSEFLIGEDSVGGVKLGMPIEDLEGILPSSKYILLKKKILHDGRYYDTFKVCDPKNRVLFFITEKDGKVWDLKILSSKYKTDLGIGIGNTLGELRINYLKNSKIVLGSSSDGIPFVTVKGLNCLFFLQERGIDFEKKSFSHKARITDILIRGSSL